MYNKFIKQNIPKNILTYEIWNNLLHKEECDEPEQRRQYSN